MVDDSARAKKPVPAAQPSRLATAGRLQDRPLRPLRYGWTTGACATAAVKAAYSALLTGTFPNPVTITLPKGQTPSFDLADRQFGHGVAMAAVIKDAGDDPDVTHGALVQARLRLAGAPGEISFRAGQGVGTVTLPGLPIAVGEPAINPAPRQMMMRVVQELAARYQPPQGVEIEIAVPGGERIARKTWNPRLGIKGGISILGTTGIVVPYSCSAWIHSIHRGIDVARANHFPHLAACVGATSERMVQKIYDLPEQAFIDMGDFVGGMLKYLRRYPVPFITIAGGFAKMSKLAHGALDLHSKRSQVDKNWLAGQLQALGAAAGDVAAARRANTALEILHIAEPSKIPIADHIADGALQTVLDTLRGAEMSVEILVSNRAGDLIGRARTAT